MCSCNGYGYGIHVRFVCSILRCDIHTGRSILNTKPGSLMTMEWRMTRMTRPIMMVAKDRTTVMNIKVGNQQILRHFSAATMTITSV